MPELEPEDDFRAPRLWVSENLVAGAGIDLDRQQANYLGNVLRLGEGASILVFNGRDGEWRARIGRSDRRTLSLLIEEQVRAQRSGPDIHYVFAPLKRARLDYVVQKATEMGVAELRPVITRRTIAARVNLERMRANVIEAAEQCGILHIPRIEELQRLERVLADWDPHRTLVFCDEGAPVGDPIAALKAARPGPAAVLIGPEGGFEPAERAAVLRLPCVVRLTLGPRIMRADTAAVAALALVNAVLGDWR
jgi:16S rRNA (uracil1498-N3)-methyltransferase